MPFPTPVISSAYTGTLTLIQNLNDSLALKCWLSREKPLIQSGLHCHAQLEFDKNNNFPLLFRCVTVIFRKGVNGSWFRGETLAWLFLQYAHEIN